MTLNRNGSPQGSISKRTVTAKGDIIAATANAIPTNLAVGSDGSTLVADSAASTGLSWAGQPYANPVLNSAFQIWQRGTSFAFAASTGGSNFIADRWTTQTNANQAITISRQVTNDLTNLPNIQYCLRYQRNSGQTGTSSLLLIQPFESINSIPYAGKTITLSYYARAGANYSGTGGGNLTPTLIVGTGTDQNPFLVPYTGGTNIISGTSSLTTTWQRFTFTGNVPTTTTELGLQFGFAPAGTAGANDYYEITGVQIDLGSVALPFRTYAGTIQGELAACQRYYYRAGVLASGGTSGGNTAMLAPYVFAQASTTAVLAIQFPTTMRVEPTVLEFSAIAYRASDTAVYPMSGATIATQTVSAAQVFATIAGATAFRTGYLAKDTNTAGYIAFSAEL